MIAATLPPATTTKAASAWTSLAHLLAARPTVRLWNPETGKFDATASLTSRLPRQPAAVYLYLRGRTQILALDFDTTRASQARVDSDFTHALKWIAECGGVAVTDQSHSGGRHILVPLAAGTSASAAEISPLMRMLEARLPSLDKTPMMNPKTGCITVPGSPCRQGGHRQLDGPLGTALEVMTRRSDPGLLPRMHVLLGAVDPTAVTPTNPVNPDLLEGTGPNTRLNPRYVRTTDLPARITTYAATGVLTPDTMWRSHSEARQSVLAHAVLHGHSLATLHALIAPGGPWHGGLAQAYARYHHSATAALNRDFAKALRWAAANSHYFRPSRAQDEKHTRGAGTGTELHRQWLANATAWIEQEFPRHRYRWIGAAVYQALSVHAVRAGELVNGVPVVGVGGRSLSIATGMLSETTVWAFLRETRDLPGSPLIRTRAAQGRQPDYYALTVQNPVKACPAAVASTRVQDVHAAWYVIGHRHRRVYELVAHSGLSDPRSVFAAAHVSSSAGYVTVAALATAGLITRRRGRLSLGETSLDDIAAAHRMDVHRARRIVRHREERAGWNAWLALREYARELAPPDLVEEVGRIIDGPSDLDRQEYLAAVLATGPPPVDAEHQALELLGDVLGAKTIQVVECCSASAVSGEWCGGRGACRAGSAADRRVSHFTAVK